MKNKLNLSLFVKYITVGLFAAIVIYLLILSGFSTTGIDEMENELLTIDNAYNLNGQRVKTPRKGVFIVNGRKTVVK